MKFDMDFSGVAKMVCPDTSKIPLKGNESRLIRVAFDLFRLKDNDSEELWKVEADCEDGQEYLVRTYSLPEDEQVKSSNWSVIADNKEENLTIAYRNIPISKIATKNYADTSREVNLLKNTIQNKFSNDNFVQKYIKSLPEVKRNMLKELGAYAEEETPKEVKELVAVWVKVNPQAKYPDLMEKNLLDMYKNKPEEFKKQKEIVFGEAKKEASDKDPLHLGPDMRVDKKLKEHKHPKTEKELEKMLEKYFNKEEKEQKDDDEPLSPFDEEDTKMENLTPEQKNLLEKVLEDAFSSKEENSVFTSTKESKRIFLLSKRAQLPQLEEFENTDKELAKILDEEDTE